MFSYITLKFYWWKPQNVDFNKEIDSPIVYSIPWKKKHLNLFYIINIDLSEFLRYFLA